MLFWSYILITALFAVIVTQELFRERNWRQQLAMVLVLVPLVLRVLLIK